MSDVDEDNFDRAFDLIRPGGNLSFFLSIARADLKKRSDTRHSRRWQETNRGRTPGALVVVVISHGITSMKLIENHGLLSSFICTDQSRDAFSSPN